MYTLNIGDHFVFYFQEILRDVLPDSYIYKVLIFPFLLSLLYSFKTNIIKLFYTIYSIDNYNRLKDTIFRKNKNAYIHFEVCMTRINGNLRIENDKAYQSIIHYILENRSDIDDLRNLKQIPDTSETFGILHDNDKVISKSKFENLYLDKNECILPNKLRVESDLKITHNNKDDLNGHSEKYYFSCSLCCDVFQTNKENMKYLLDEYNKMNDSYKEFQLNNNIHSQFCYYYDSHSNNMPYFNKLFIGDIHKSFESIFFEKKNYFLKNINHFVHNKEHYQKVGKPYRNIILSYGEPGCGKTSIIHGLLHLFETKYNQKKQLIHLNLDKLSKKDLQNIFFKETIPVNNENSGQIYIPFHSRIYFIEELDGCKSVLSRDIKHKDEKEIQKNNSNVIEMKVGMDNKTSLSVQDLLEVLDGPLSLNNGEIIVMTTNYIENIDKALFRPGRVNNLLELKRSTIDDMRCIFEYFYDTTFHNEQFNAFCDYQFTPALISEACNHHMDNYKDCIHYLKTYKEP